MAAPPNHRRSTAIALLVVLALLAAACSDGSDDVANGATTTTAFPSATTTTLVPRPAAEVVADAFVWGFPLVTTTRTLSWFSQLIGTNQLLWTPQLMGPQSRLIVAPNRDTIYSIAVLDLTGGPMALSLPAVPDRYYAYQLLDAWSESFAYIGTRATDGRAGTWVVTPPGWDGELPPDVEQLASPTPQVFVLGRFVVDDDADIANIGAIKTDVTLQSLSEMEGGEAPVLVDLPPPAGPPFATGSNGIEFWDELATALESHPPGTAAGRTLRAELDHLGIGAGTQPSVDLADGELRDLLTDAVATALPAMLGQYGERTNEVDGWRIATGLGRYGDDFVTRAVISRFGWGANVPEEAIYPVSTADAAGDGYDGSRTYRIRFAAGELPPVDAFWSLSVYGQDMFFTPHDAGRWTIGDRTDGLEYGADGSLELTLSHAEPAGGRSNWLPVPEDGFVLMLRLYLPGDEVQAGDWTPPPVERVDE